MLVPATSINVNKTKFLPAGSQHKLKLKGREVNGSTGTEEFRSCTHLNLKPRKGGTRDDTSRCPFGRRDWNMQGMLCFSRG